jgi:hypothetical protein
MNQRNSFTFYRSYYEAIKELSIEQQRALYTAIIEFSFISQRKQSESKR